MKPLRISWSAVRAWEECKEKSYLLRAGKRAKVTNIRNFYPGMVVDTFMREYLDHAMSRDTPAGDWVSMIMNESEVAERDRGNMIKYRDASDRRKVHDFCTELVGRLIPLLQEHVVPYKHEHGKWFKVPLSLEYRGEAREVLLTGEMDLLIDNGGPVVWDLKGTADDQYWRKVVAQLTFYDLAVWFSTGTKTRFVGLIQPMCKEPLLAFEVTDAARADLMTRIQRYAFDAWEAKRECTDDASKCHWCDVKHACSKYSTSNFDALGTLADGLRSAAGETA